MQSAPLIDDVRMDAATAGLYATLLTQGVAWVLGHCPGMCGPLVIGLGFSGVRSLLLYQAGKACTYALFGGIAGALGGIMVIGLRQWGPAVMLAVAAAMVVCGGWRLVRPAGFGPAAVPRWLSATVRQWSAGRRGPFVLGLVLAFIPCGVVVWALGLAVASADALHGALLLVCLVLLNTPVLVAAHLLGRGPWLWRLRQRLGWLPPVTLLLTGVWLAWLTLTVGAPRCG